MRTDDTDPLNMNIRVYFLCYTTIMCKGIKELRKNKR